MAFNQRQYDALCSAIAKGVTSLDLGNGEKVTYRSLDEMIRIKAMMEIELSGGPRKTGLNTPTFSRGQR